MSLSDVRKLAALAEKPARRIIGLMSGTSLDGLDIALCRVAGSGSKTSFSLDRFVTKPFAGEFRDKVLACFARFEVSLEALTLLNVTVAETHARLILDALAEWDIAPDTVDLLASHGQTIYHAPKSLHGHTDEPNATLQLGDGDHLSRRTGIITCSDFRQKHIAAGGEGAPLAVYGDRLLLSAEEGPRILLNIGGIANLTYLPPKTEDGVAFSSDIGPGNTLMDAYVRKHFAPRAFDEGGALAASGRVHERLLARLLEDPFFALDLPKTTGPEHFSLFRFETEMAKTAPDLCHEDALATLNRLSAEGIAAAIGKAQGRPDIFVSGGGAHNPVLRRHLSELLPGYRIEDTASLGLDPDAKEAVLFAVLANELVAGEPSNVEGFAAGAPGVTMGKISLPL